MTGSAALTFFSPARKKTDDAPSYFPGILRRESGGHSYSINLWVGIPVAFAAGFISSLIGIGGGFAKMPLMTLAFGMPVNAAIATSSVGIVITCLAGFAGHGAAGNVDLRLA
ncbi:MAG TPA: sulfite exporter TauE/SafE family protein, partial [Candidatus Goldiibacteriota bacterium]|nr:sulfite exporter TauE/SafE family protein [Candidatus Goldiibacteriota bacterium]